ncbi:MAG: tryptophan--tRNA ligase [Pseudomonadota bacterium]
MIRPKRIFSGIQPSGDLHLGNYLGAIRNWVKLQHDYQCIFCVVDLHAITVYQDPQELQRSIREVAACIIAAGIDIDKHLIFVQSTNKDHAYLAWLFNCVARIGWLNRMTQFKDKVGKNREAASVGLYAYPALMASDILAYHATHVPVGEDQKQHLELARDIAIKFNQDWDCPHFFPEVEPIISSEVARIMSLRDGTKKMSKSDPSDFSRINLLDDPDLMVEKIRKARTDSEGLPSDEQGLANRPEARNLVGIYASLSDLSVDDALRDLQNMQFAPFKARLSELLISRLTPVSTVARDLLKNPGDLDHILKKGSSEACAISNPIIDQTAKIMGLTKGF